MDCGLAVEHRRATHQTSVQQVKVETRGRERDRLHPGTSQPQFFELATVCRFFHEHRVAGGDQELRGEMARVLCSISDQNLLGRSKYAVLGKPVCNGRT
ncbi:hypothetical protein BFS79_02680 [Cutibacterium avidum]|nr:hypothetical protein BFS79_02680 [Cutibacterium avidum]